MQHKHWKNTTKSFEVRHIRVERQPLQTLTLSPGPCPFILSEPRSPLGKVGETRVGFLVRIKLVKEHEVLTE